MIQALPNIFYREWLNIKRSKGQWAEPWIFMILIVSIVPMLNGNSMAVVPLLSISLLWLSILLSLMLTLDKVLRYDFLDGTFEHWILGPYPLWWLLCLKSLAHWCLWVLPMIVVAPFLMMMMHVPSELYSATMLGLLLGTPVFSFLGIAAASLTLTVRASGLLMALIFIPMCIPVLLLALSAAASASYGAGIAGHLALLSALSILSVIFLPQASAFGVRIGMN